LGYVSAIAAPAIFTISRHASPHGGFLLTQICAEKRRSFAKKAGNVIETHEHVGDCKEW
jgi:hypothetical protein